MFVEWLCQGAILLNLFLRVFRNFCFGCIGEIVESDGAFRHISDTSAMPVNDRNEQLQAMLWTKIFSKSI